MKVIYSAGDNTLNPFKKEDLTKYAASLYLGNPIPCDPSCKDAGWKDGQVLQLGVDFGLGSYTMENPTEEFWREHNGTRAYPIKPSTPSTDDQDELWEEFLQVEFMLQIKHLSIEDKSKKKKALISDLKQKYTITRKNGKS
jgi:hypothetical protein